MANNNASHNFTTTETRDTTVKSSKQVNSSMSVHNNESINEENFHPDLLTENDDNDSTIMILNNASDSSQIVTLLKIPEYLQASTINSILEKMLQEKVYHSASMINAEELRQITLLMHQSYVLDLEQSLWNYYLKSGTGLLHIDQLYLKLWPSEVKTMIQATQSSTTNNNNNDDQNQTTVTDGQCAQFVQEYLCEMNEKQQRLQNELARKKKNFVGYENAIDNALQTFVQEQTNLLRLENQYNMKLVNFEYREHVLDRAFQVQKPNEQQIELTKRLFARKYEYERAKQDVTWIKEYVQEKKLPNLFRTISLPLPTDIQLLTDKDLHDHLSDCHHKIIQQYKHDMTTIYINIFEAKLNDTKTLFDEDMSKIQQNQYVLSPSQQFNSTMLDLINQHLSVITEKVQCRPHHINAPMTIE